MSFPRAKKRKIADYKAMLRIDVDFSSTGIWEIPEPLYRYAGSCRSYESLDLPAWLADRFHYWTTWHDAHELWHSSIGYDTELYRAYAFSLAVDLKRILGEDYYIEFGGREIHDDRSFLRERLDRPA